MTHPLARDGVSIGDCHFDHGEPGESR
jgi:hypothetical protein